jgi:hypothetical protein
VVVEPTPGSDGVVVGATVVLGTVTEGTVAVTVGTLTVGTLVVDGSVTVGSWPCAFSGNRARRGTIEIRSAAASAR